MFLRRGLCDDFVSKVKLFTLVTVRQKPYFMHCIYTLIKHSKELDVSRVNFGSGQM